MQQFDIVDTASDGKDALNQVLQHETNYYNVILLDISMPVMDGMEACVKMLAHFANFPSQ